MTTNQLPQTPEATFKVDTWLVKLCRFFNDRFRGITVCTTIHLSSHIFEKRQPSSLPIFYPKSHKYRWLTFDEVNLKYSDFTIEHELEHVRQFRKNPWTFYPRYVGQYLAGLWRELLRDGERHGWKLWRRIPNLFKEIFTMHSDRLGFDGKPYALSVLTTAYKSMPYEVEADIAAEFELISALQPPADYEV